MRALYLNLPPGWTFADQEDEAEQMVKNHLIVRDRSGRQDSCFSAVDRTLVLRAFTARPDLDRVAVARLASLEFSGGYRTRKP